MNRFNINKESEMSLGEKIFIVVCLISFLTILKFSGSGYPTLQPSDYKITKK